MQLQAIQSDRSFLPKVVEQQSANSPLKGRACCNWQMTFMVLSVATAVASIAMFLFLSLPLFALIFTGVGMLEVGIYLLAAKKEGNAPTIAEYNSLKKANDLLVAKQDETPKPDTIDALTTERDKWKGKAEKRQQRLKFKDQKIIALQNDLEALEVRLKTQDQ